VSQLKLFHALAAAVVLMMPAISPRDDRLAEDRDDTRMEAVARSGRDTLGMPVPKSILVAIDSETGQVFRYDMGAGAVTAT
jgi:hypothetical protein